MSNSIVHILKVDQRLVSLLAHLAKGEYNIIVHEQYHCTYIKSTDGELNACLTKIQIIRNGKCSVIVINN